MARSRSFPRMDHVDQYEENGDYKAMERFLPSYQPIEPIDIKFGPNGDLYVLEYGSNWFRKSDNSKLVTY